MPQHAGAVGGSGAPEIDEGLISTTLYVSPDPLLGNDLNPGTENQPLATITKAFNLYNGGTGGYKIILLPGIHRPGAIAATQALSIPGVLSATRPLIIEGAGWSPGLHTGDVILSGSEDWSGGWTVAGSENGRTAYEKAWPYDWGLSTNIFEPNFTPPDTVRTYHQVVVDGVVYYEVLNAADPHVANVADSEGYFYVDESSNFIRVVPPAAFADLNGALVEVSVRRTLLRFFRSQTETSPTPLAVRNIVFRHAAPGLASGAFRSQNHNGFIIEDCRFHQNKNRGIVLEGNSASSFTLRRCAIAESGTTGGGFNAVGALVEDCLFEANSRQADVSQYYGWDYGGFKMGASSNSTFRNVVARNNYGIGFWFDTACRGILVEDCLSEGNSTTGIFIENNNRNNLSGLGSDTTVEVRRTTLRANIQTSPQNFVTGRGLYITESENVVIDDCVIEDNTIQIRVSDGPGRGPVSNIQLSNSNIRATDSSQALIIAGGNTSWTEFINTYSPLSDFNTWYYPGSTIAFPDASRNITLDLDGWKALVGAEPNSTWDGVSIEVIIETSLDGINWTPTTDGLHDITQTGAFFRLRIE
ncbi:MAG: right-handed parallel beta-helix repeat-containing protein [Oceanipulchritudo sp.]